MKPPLTYYGGKQTLSKRIISLIPKHNLYCEPFFGGGAVFFAKEPSEVEIINDTNGDIINFYKVIKTKFRKLEREIRSTLHSRQYHQSAKIVLGYPFLFDEVKRAWAVWVLCNQSFGARMDNVWGYDFKQNTTPKRLQHKRALFTTAYAERLEEAQIECRDALQIIEKTDSKDCFFYLDPPYHNSNQGHYKGYTEQDFINLLEKLKNIKGKFLLSSYPSEILEAYTKKNKWFTQKIELPVSIHLNRDVKPKMKTEVLTANYEIIGQEK
jgi:DNA adenine methylase